MALPTNIYAEVSTYFPGTIAPGAGISVSKSGNVWTVRADMSGIPVNSVELDKLEQIAADRLLGADAAGDVTPLAATGGVEFTGAGGIRRSAISGDVSVPAGSGTATIEPGAVTTAKIADGAVTGPKIAADAVDGPKIADDAVTTAKIADSNVTLAKIQDLAADRLLGADDAGAPVELTASGGLEFTGSGGIRRSALTGDVTAAAGSNATTIADDAVTLAKMDAATRGDLITYDPNGDPAYLNAGAAGQAPIVNASGDLVYGGITDFEDYEEGTFTPTFAGSTTPGTQTYSFQDGRYIRIGNVVHFIIRLVMTAKDGATSGTLLVSGLPFTSRDIPIGAYPAMIYNWANLQLNDGSGYTAVVTSFSANSTDIILQEAGDNITNANLGAADLSATSAIAVGGFYLIN